MALCYQPNIVVNGLQLAYDAANPKCYAGVGTFVNDLSGNRNTGYLFSGASYSSNLTGYFSFDGSDDYIGTNYIIDYDYLTVNVWFWSGAFSTFPNYTCILANQQNSNPYQTFDLRKKAGSVRTIEIAFSVDANTTAYQLDIGDLNDYAWYNLQFSYDGLIFKVWLNGLQVVSYSLSSTLRSSNIPLMIAKNPSFVRNAAINVSQVFIYNRALSEAEIQRNYNATKQRYIYSEDVISDGLVSAFDIGSALSYTGSGSRIYNALSSLGGTADLRDGATIAGSGSSAYINLSGSSANVVAFSPNTFLSLSMLVWITTSQYYVYYLLDGRNDIAGSYYYAPDGGGYTNLYVNGVKKTVVGLSNNTVFPRDQWLHIYLELPSLSTGSMYFGNRFSFNEPLSGRLSAIQFYNRSLSPAEIKQNYQALRGRYGV
jgi:hypothetical protein